MPQVHRAPRSGEPCFIGGFCGRAQGVVKTDSSGGECSLNKSALDIRYVLYVQKSFRTATAPAALEKTTLIPVLSRPNLEVITSSLLRPEGGVSMRTDGQDGNLEHWRDLYTAALVELSSDKLPQRIRNAQRAIVDEIEGAGGFQMEHQPLLDALLVLLDLEKNHRPGGHTSQINKSA